MLDTAIETQRAARFLAERVRGRPPRWVKELGWKDGRPSIVWTDSLPEAAAFGAGPATTQVAKSLDLRVCDIHEAADYAQGETLTQSIIRALRGFTA
jgi:hypothetical protein